MKHDGKLTQRAQTLRREMTREEKRLWYEYLHNYPHRFRRQVTCGNYILDFYCSAARLAVELDGSQHYEPAGQSYDAHRDSYLEQQGIMVLRFSNSDVNDRLRGVCDAIDRAVVERRKAIQSALERNLR